MITATGSLVKTENEFGDRLSPCRKSVTHSIQSVVISFKWISKKELEYFGYTTLAIFFSNIYKVAYLNQ